MKKRELLNILREEGWEAGIEEGSVCAMKYIGDRVVKILPEVREWIDSERLLAIYSVSRDDFIESLGYIDTGKNRKKYVRIVIDYNGYVLDKPKITKEDIRNMLSFVIDWAQRQDLMAGLREYYQSIGYGGLRILGHITALALAGQEDKLQEYLEAVAAGRHDDVGLPPMIKPEMLERALEVARQRNRDGTALDLGPLPADTRNV